MAERLTRKIGYEYEKAKRETQLLEINNKLGKLEDILEKYDLEVEELDDLIANYRTSPILTEEMIKEIAVNEQRKVIQSLIKEITEKECNQLYTELNTWKRACELAIQNPNSFRCPHPPEYYNAQDEYGSDEPYYIQESACEFSDDTGRCLECQMDYFYQQAKKEGEQK